MSDEPEVHVVHQELDSDEAGRYFWDCSCGRGGYGPQAEQLDAHIDEHIPPGAIRIDRPEP